MNLSIESVEARAGRGTSRVGSTWLKRSLRKPSNLWLWRINGSGRNPFGRFKSANAVRSKDSYPCTGGQHINPVERFLLAKKQSWRQTSCQRAAKSSHPDSALQSGTLEFNWPKMKPLELAKTQDQKLHSSGSFLPKAWPGTERSQEIPLKSISKCNCWVRSRWLESCWDIKFWDVFGFQISEPPVFERREVQEFTTHCSWHSCEGGRRDVGRSQRGIEPQEPTNLVHFPWTCVTWTWFHRKVARCCHPRHPSAREFKISWTCKQKPWKPWKPC